MNRRPPKRQPPPEPGAHSATDRALADRLLDLLRQGADARPGKISRVKSSVDASTYENDLKLSIAVDRLSRDM